MNDIMNKLRNDLKDLRVQNATLLGKVILRSIWNDEKKELERTIERQRKENSKLATELKKYKDIVEGPQKAAEAETRRIEKETKAKAKAERLAAIEKRKQGEKL